MGLLRQCQRQSLLFGSSLSRAGHCRHYVAKPGEALFYIVDTEHLKVSFEVLENEVAYYENDPILSVSTVAFPNVHHPATLSGITPVVDDNGMVHIEATLQPHPHLSPGMTAFVTVRKK